MQKSVVELLSLENEAPKYLGVYFSEPCLVHVEHATTNVNDFRQYCIQSYIVYLYNEKSYT